MSESLNRINRELRRAVGAGLPVLDARSTLAISSPCSTFRRIRPDLDKTMAWIEVYMHDLGPLIALLVGIADAACRARADTR